MPKATIMMGQKVPINQPAENPGTKLPSKKTKPKVINKPEKNIRLSIF